MPKSDSFMTVKKTIIKYIYLYIYFNYPNL